MFNLDKHTIEFACPLCGFYNSIFFIQARLRDVVICRGCKSNIQLDDHMNECRKARESLNRALRGLESSLKDITIGIRL
jgi:predicted RNA-binding Zn-ribbon protein involved in translation (DUF1610 family)